MLCPCTFCNSTGDESQISPYMGKNSLGQETPGVDKPKEMLRISLSEEWQRLCLCEQGGALLMPECLRAWREDTGMQVLREGWEMRAGLGAALSLRGFPRVPKRVPGGVWALPSWQSRAQLPAAVPAPRGGKH